MAYTGISQPLQTTAFGDLDVAQYTPRVQLQFPYNINTLEVTTATTGSGTVTFSQPFAVCSTGAATSSTASLSSQNGLHYHCGEGGAVIFTCIFTAGAANSTQWAGLANSVDALWFGYNGTSFGINRRFNGSDNFVAQSSWNVDPLNGTGASGMTLVPTNGNVYKIQYQWLGFGNINFFVENPTTGKFVLVHMIQFSNANTSTSLLNPAMNLNIQANNTTNNTNIVIKSSSMAGFVEGQVVNLGLSFSASSGVMSINSGSTQAILTIRNNTTFNGITNRKSVTPASISLYNANQIVLWTLILDATLGGSPSFTNVNANTSVVSYDISATTATGGTVLGSYYLFNNKNEITDISSLFIRINPGHTLTAAAFVTAGGAINGGAAINWSEQF